MKEKRSLLKLTDLSSKELGDILELSHRLKVGRGQADQPLPLNGQTWALMFHKSSTRTRVSFEVGIHELGGHVMNLDQSKMQTGRGETVEDTAKVLSRYIHGIVIRTFGHDWLEQFTAASDLHVVNGLTDALHPCQVLTDLFTLAERWGQPGQLLQSLAGRKVAFYGDCASNMAHSWILGGALTGMKIVLSGPEPFAPKPFIKDLLKAAGLPCSYQFTTDPMEAARGADAVYTDVWVSMGDEAEREQRIALLQPWQVNQTIMEAASPDAWFLHCLPAHEGEEVSSDVYHGSRSIVFDEAENRLHAQKALLCFLANPSLSL